MKWASYREPVFLWPQRYAERCAGFMEVIDSARWRRCRWKRLAGHKPAAQLVYVGEAEYGRTLKAQAEAAGVMFDAVAYP